MEKKELSAEYIVEGVLMMTVGSAGIILNITRLEKDFYLMSLQLISIMDCFG